MNLKRIIKLFTEDEWLFCHLYFLYISPSLRIELFERVFFVCFFLQHSFYNHSFSNWFEANGISHALPMKEREKNSIKHLIQRKFLSNVLINSAFVTSASSKFAHYAHCRPRMPTNGVEVSALCLSSMIHLILIYWGSVCSAYYAVSYALDFHFLFRSVFL